jgi:glycosyltransferase involved in cell wall biosynthesis
MVAQLSKAMAGAAKRSASDLTAAGFDATRPVGLTANFARIGRDLQRRLRRSRIAASPRASDDLRVFLTTPPWTIFRSTDRDYVYNSFTRLAEHWRLGFAAPESLAYLARISGHHVLVRAAEMTHLPAPAPHRPQLNVPKDTDVVFSYGVFPAREPAVPIIWEQTFALPLHADHQQWLADVRVRAQDIVARASRVATATTVSADFFVQAFPAHADKICVVPYYLPYLEPIDDLELDRKCQDRGLVRMLFVGKEARRKGLDTFAAAWMRLPVAIRNQISVEVVSAMLDGAVELPPEWERIHHAPDVARLMRAAHVLVFPTKQEAFGLVLVEAMAAGCALVTTSAIVQRCIVGPDAGIFGDPHDPGALADVITQLVNDRSMLEARMRAARDRFLREYHHRSVGRRYGQLLWETAGRTGAVPSREP